MLKYEDLSIDMISKRIPRFRNAIEPTRAYWATHAYELTPYDFLYSGFVLDILELYKRGEFAGIQEYFDFAEWMLQNSEDEKIEDLVQVGFLEYFWESPELYNLARKCAGEKTKVLFGRVSAYLGGPYIEKAGKQP